MIANDATFMAPWDPTKMSPDAYQQHLKIEEERRQTLRFVGGLTWFHEFAHIFVTYLAGNNYCDTPPEVNNASQSNIKVDDVGESGYWFETQVVGGIVDLKPSMFGGEISQVGVQFVLLYTRTTNIYFAASAGLIDR